MTIKPDEIIEFWYSSRIKEQWFSATVDLDREIETKYAFLWKQASRGDLSAWLETAKGCLALAIILDQFPLNMFRGKPESFSTEAMAIEVVQHALDKEYDKQLQPHLLPFLYMPLMHSENIKDQEYSVALFKATNLKSNLEFAEHHKNIIEMYGRFPHRNEILGRESTEQELAYLNSKHAFRG